MPTLPLSTRAAGVSTRTGLSNSPRSLALMCARRRRVGRARGKTRSFRVLTPAALFWLRSPRFADDTDRDALYNRAWGKYSRPSPTIAAMYARCGHSRGLDTGCRTAARSRRQSSKLSNSPSACPSANARRLTGRSGGESSRSRARTGLGWLPGRSFTPLWAAHSQPFSLQFFWCSHQQTHRTTSAGCLLRSRRHS